MSKDNRSRQSFLSPGDDEPGSGVGSVKSCDCFGDGRLGGRIAPVADGAPGRRAAPGLRGATNLIIVEEPG